MRIVMTMIGLGAMLTAVPAAAADSPASPASAKSTKAAAGKQATYCIQYEPDTGSRIAATECKSKAQWEKEGVNVDQLTKQGR